MSKLADKNNTTNPLDINIFYSKIEVTSGVDELRKEYSAQGCL